MPLNFLNQYAKSNIWCNPTQDKQAIFQPARVTDFPGDLAVFHLNRRKYDLPDLVNRYYVYMIGKLNAKILGILPRVRVWTRLDECCIAESMVMQVYTSGGKTFPLHKLYYRFNADGNLLFAIPHIPRLGVSLHLEPIYIKFYSNAFYRTEDSNVIDDEIFVAGFTASDNNSIANFQNSIASYTSNPVGKCFFYVNGIRVHQIYPGNMVSGDIGEVVYDGTIREEFVVPVLQLEQFDSDLDDERKYLVMNPVLQNQIDFYDDLEFYIQSNAAGHRGVYYHKNMPSSVRMVTHQDYSIRVDSVVALAASLGISNPEDAYLSVIIRKSGIVRGLASNHHRTHELFKLPLAERKAAMLGIDSNVEVWRAPNLENSNYTALMRQVDLPIPQELVDGALGYNAISKIIGDSPLLPIDQSGIKSVHLPYGLVDSATVYEFDADGKYLRHNVHHGIGEDAVVGNDCALIEAFAGEADVQFDDQYGPSFTIDPLHEYRFYKAFDTADEDTYEWVDVTGSGDYTITGQNGVWTIDTNAYKTIVRSDAKFVHREINHSTLFGTIEILLNEVEGALQTRMQVPPGTLDVFLNDYCLTRGVDYHFTFPKLTVINVNRLVNPGVATQKVVFRAMAFPRPDLTMEELEDTGFIADGKLSANNRFDLRDDKVQQIVIDGLVHFKNEIPFMEEDEFSPYLETMNGKPYHLKDVIVPTRKLTLQSTSQMREVSLVVDKQIRDYLTLKAPQPDLGFYTVPTKYAVVSPFFARMTVLVKAVIIPAESIEGHLTDNEVIDLCAPYMEFLQHDPTTEAYSPDARFVEIIPHFYNYIVNLSAPQFRFLSRVNKLICGNKLNMAPFYTITT